MGKWLDMAKSLGEGKISPKRIIPAPAKPAKLSIRKEACFWQYKLNNNLSGFIQMGLMTSDPTEAQRQLTEIYGKPVTGLHKKTRVNEGD